MRKTLLTALVLGGLLLSFPIGIVEAAVTPSPVPTIEIPWLVGFKDIPEAIGAILRWSIFFGIIICAIWLIWGGFQYIIAGDDPEKAEAARTRITNAVIGLMIVISIFLILKLLTIIVPRLDEIIKL